MKKMSNKDKCKHQAEETKLKSQEAAADTQDTAESADSAETSEKQKEAEETEETKEDSLAKVQAELEELKDKYLRTIAEFENYRKRTQKEKAELIFNGGEKTISAILPVLDDMERAVANSVNAEDIKSLEAGWELIFQKTSNHVRRHGSKENRNKGQRL